MWTKCDWKTNWNDQNNAFIHKQKSRFLKQEDSDKIKVLDLYRAKLFKTL